MRDIQHVQLVNSPELADDIDTLDIGEAQSLLEIHDVGAIRQLESVVSIIDGPHDDETVIISTEIKAGESATEAEEFAACFSSNIFHGVEQGHIGALGPEEIGAEVVKLVSGPDDAETIVMVKSLDSWIVRSSILLPCGEPIDESTRVPEIVKEHVFISNALLAALSGRLLAVTGEEATSHNLYLRMKPLLELPPPEKEAPFEKYIGINDVVTQLERFVQLANTPDTTLIQHGFSREQAVLLQGPSGVGKTDLVHSLAISLGAEKRPIRFGDISGGNVGEWAKKIQKKFDAAVEDAETGNKRILIHFDEADGLLTPGNDGTARNISSVLKDCLDRIRDIPNVFVAFTANPNQVLDPNVFNDKRVPLRIDIPRSSEETLRDVLAEIAMQNAVTAVDTPSVELEVAVENYDSDIDIDMIAKLLHEKEFTAGDLIEIVKNIRKNHLIKQQQEGIENPRPVILTQAKLLEGIKEAVRRRSGITREN